MAVHYSVFTSGMLSTGLQKLLPGLHPFSRSHALRDCEAWERENPVHIYANLYLESSVALVTEKGGHYGINRLK